jgi:hypothetical protein
MDCAQKMGIELNELPAYSDVKQVSFASALEIVLSILSLHNPGECERCTLRERSGHFICN